MYGLMLKYLYHVNFYRVFQLTVAECRDMASLSMAVIGNVMACHPLDTDLSAKPVLTNWC